MQKGQPKAPGACSLVRLYPSIKLDILINSFTKSQLDYCPLVWMFHDRVPNSKLKLIQERALRLVCKDSATEYDKLINKTLTTHQHNLQLLMIELRKMRHSLNSTIMRDVFIERNNQHYLENEIICNYQ